MLVEVMDAWDAAVGGDGEVTTAEIGDEDNGEYDVLRQRLKQLQTWHDKARAVVPLAKTFLQLT